MLAQLGAKYFSTDLGAHRIDSPKTTSIARRPPPSAAMKNARERLKELRDKHPTWTPLVYTARLNATGDLSKAPFCVDVVVRDEAGVVRYSGASGEGHPTLDAAKEAACADALVPHEALFGDESAERTRSLAWLGDTGLEFYLALLGARARLPAAALDGISQQLLSNQALAAGAPVQLASVTLTATGVEADIGRSLEEELESLFQPLERLMQEANPALALRLQQAVAARAAGQP
jgi:hypothetical protein